MEHFIMKDDGKLYHVEMPEKPIPYGVGDEQYFGARMDEYNESVQQAIENAVEVSNQKEVYERLFGVRFKPTNHAWKDGTPYIYSLECKVKKYYTAASDIRTIEEMMDGVTLTEKPLVPGKLVQVYVSFEKYYND